ncbi:tRNA glutamyl-Q(34) synthetase GluQRS [Aliidiomarina sp. Khilg15.8]
MAQPGYRGRFAPTPSGPLHAGSLVAALGSYLDAKAQQGKWLVRIEDIDPPREVQGAAATILQQLEAHGLHWDDSVSYQSQHDDAYQAALDSLRERQLLYYCDCTRKQIKARAPYYTGFCRDRKVTAENAALRFKNDQPVLTFDDRLHGTVKLDSAFACEDFVVKRRDGLWAYQLAVVVDDMRQGITHIVRGSDLLIPSAWQLTLWRALSHCNGSLTDIPMPQLAHLPLVTDASGAKLSKQNHAQPLDNAVAADNLMQALRWLHMAPPGSLAGASVESLLAWAVEQWRATRI